MSDANLSGRHVLIVEDRYLIASEMADVVRDLGGEVLGPAPSLEAAAELLETQRPDFAVLDVNLDGELVFPLAETLERGATPFIFLTGYSDDTLPPSWRERPRLVKPVDPRLLRETLVRLAAANPASS